VPEFEFPGVFVEETGRNPKPIEGVPTNAFDGLSKGDWARWLYGIAVGGAALGILGLWLTITREQAILRLFLAPAGVAGIGAIVVAAFVLGISRSMVEWRRRKAGRPPLRLGWVQFGVVAFQLAHLVAVGICLAALLGSLLVARAYTLDLVAAAINVLIGGTFVWMAGVARRDLLLILQAARTDR
jgi:hypothetical protein